MELTGIGIIYCNCNGNLKFDLNHIENAIKKIEDIAFFEQHNYLCSSCGKDFFMKTIEENGKSKLLIAGCSPRNQALIFYEWAENLNIPRSALEIVNIREGCAWISGNREKATQTDTVISLIRQGIARLKAREVLEDIVLPINKSCLVIGGGISGITAASDILDQGYKVYIVEKEGMLGGSLRRFDYIAPSFEKSNNWLKRKLELLREAKILISSEIRSIEGHLGNFTVNIESGDKSEKIDAGAIIVATGLSYGENKFADPLIIEEKLKNDQIGKEILFIQSLSDKDPRELSGGVIDALLMMKYAYLIKKSKPDIKVTVLYKSLPQEFTQLINECRKLSVDFIHYEIIEELSENLVIYNNEKETMEIRSSCICLPIKWKAREENKSLTEILHLVTDIEGFIVDDIKKLRMKDTLPSGIYVCGSAHKPCTVSQAIIQAHGAAYKVINIFKKETARKTAKVSSVNEIYCRACGRCIESCPYKAISFTEKNEGKFASVDVAFCQGCGICLGVCISGAIKMKYQSEEEIRKAVHAVLED